MNHPKAANDNNTTRIAVLETNMVHIHETLERIDKRFEGIDRRFDALIHEMRDMRKESWSQFRWVMGAVFFGIFIPIVLKGIHWL